MPTGRDSAPWREPAPLRDHSASTSSCAPKRRATCFDSAAALGEPVSSASAQPAQPLRRDALLFCSLRSVRSSTLEVEALRREGRRDAVAAGQYVSGEGARVGGVQRRQQVLGALRWRVRRRRRRCRACRSSATPQTRG